jgi:membrane protein involved in colicin uptake
MMAVVMVWAESCTPDVSGDGVGGLMQRHGTCVGGVAVMHDNGAFAGHAGDVQQQQQQQQASSQQQQQKQQQQAAKQQQQAAKQRNSSSSS